MRVGLPIAVRAALWLLLAGAALGSTLAAAQPVAAGAVITIAAARAVLEPDGGPRREGEVDLGRRWEADYPARGGRAVYTLALPPRSNPEPMALLFSRVGNQVHVQVNGVTVQRWGELGEPRFDASKTAAMVALPAALLYADRPNELRVEVTIQRQRLGGLSVLRYGPQSAVVSLYDQQRRWHDSPMLVFAAGLAGMSLLAAMLWWRQRDALYAWFGLAALLGVARNLDRSWPDVPVPWPHLGAIVAVCSACHIVLMCRFSLMVIGPVSRRMRRVISAAIVLESALFALAYELGHPLLATLGFALMVPLGLATLVPIVRQAFAGSASARVLTAAVALAVAAGVHDLVMIRFVEASGLRLTLSQHAMFAFVLIMGGLLAERYSRSVADYHALNADLSNRVDERERQLHGAFDAMREQHHQQSVSTERQRIMREIHDGVGSQLVGLLNMVARPGTDPEVLKQQVQQALDEMRMAVDAWQPAHDDLVTVLATLRYRLQPRLQAAGIEVVWDVAELPALRQLAPHEVLQIQRILLEAFTNVLKHSRAAQVTVRARCDAAAEPVVKLQISDNGVGLDSGAADPRRQGHGIVNMKARAASIGALLRVEPQAGGGACVALEWQVRPASARVVG